MAFDFYTYMKDVATRHKSIKHSDTSKRFYEVSGIGGLEDCLMNIQSMSGIILMVESNQEGQVMRTNTDHVVDLPRYIFYVCKQGEVGNEVNNNQVKRECKTLAFNILGKLNFDRINGSREGSSANRDIDLSQVRYDSVGPMLDSWFGCMVEFGSISSAVQNGMTYNADDYE